ncbi:MULTISPECIES: hypothetical protein [unclassified Oceanispirochaeta]|uniref:hypothetical protein n=1 Tax=unclassified Oceanispirochaeta TaxID=2635722 RepID=UPI000E094FD4|nr:MULTISPECIES: hypothetical protein [unclassified Oceanispirochaeta]MBF9018994.1 hypothetical protein [Oceanispirochaeta sp. M2]NPD75494.1 hypothetical protein [Oceanispirochaeta sp. M1]RDG28651.1 hypothetical protein DV872_25705 [Oceanispirochaeta sp. M1]
MAREYSEINSNEIVEINRQIILQGISGTITPEQVESSAMFAVYLQQVGITINNYHLFLKLLETNNQWIVDGLIGKKKPDLLFSSLKPNYYLLNKAFQFLTCWHPGQIYEKVLLAVLGIIQYGFHKPDDGYRIYKLEISDINNLGKFLNEEFDQFQEVNETILEILDRLAGLGEFSNNSDKSILAKHSYNIRISYFDNTKNLFNIIPKVLLVKLKREDREIKPSKDFITLFSKKFHN